MRGRAAVTWTLSSLAVLALVAAALAWILTTEFALHWALERVMQASGGRVIIERAQRTGIGSMRAQRVVYTDEALEIEARNVKIDVTVASLLRRRPVAHAIDIERLAIRPLRAEAKPLSLPATLELPLYFAIERLRVQTLALIEPDHVLELHAIDLSGGYDAHGYRLNVAHLETPWGGLRGALHLVDRAPFALDAAMQIDPKQDGLAVIYANVAGRLDAIGVGAIGAAYGGRLLARATITPFDRVRQAELTIDVDGLELRAIDASWPQANLGVGVEAKIAAGARVAGRLHVRNAMPGLLADRRLPLQSVSAAFEGEGQRLSLDDIVLDARPVGRLTGVASVQADAVSARLVAAGLNLRALSANLKTTALNGPLRITSTGGGVDIDAAFAQPGTSIAIAARYAGSKIEVRTARWRGNAGEIDLGGSIQARAPYAFKAAGRIASLDPARLGEFPAARLNARFEAHGQAVPFEGSIELGLADSRFRNQPLSGQGRARIMPQRIVELDAELRLASARMRAQGSLGAAQDRLAWEIEAPDLRVLDASASGRLAAKGSVRGRFADPAFDFQADGAGVRWGDSMRAASLAARGTLAEGLKGRFEIDARGSGLVAGALALDDARLDVRGTRERHDMHIAAADGSYRFEARASGALGEGPSWRGTIASLQVAGPIRTALERPVSLAASPSAVSVGAASVQIGAGRIELAGLDWRAGGVLASRGSVKSLALATLRPVLPIPEPLQPLVVAGEWDVAAGDTLRVVARARRESGDITLPGPPRIAAGLQGLSIEVQSQGADIRLQASLASSAFGQAEASGTVRAEKRDGMWKVAADAPLTVQARTQMPSLAWAQPWLGDRVRLDGRAALELALSGTLRNPSYRGEVRASALEMSFPELGFALREGIVSARLDGQKVQTTALRFAAAGGGEISGVGSATLTPGNITAALDLTAHQLTVVSRPDRVLVLSGQSRLAWDSQQLRAQGKLAVDRGLIELPREDTPTPSGDVVVLNAPPAPQGDVQLQADMQVDLGKDFTVRGRGLDTKVSGLVQAQLAPKSRPTVKGTVRAVDGTYTAFGQTLKIERGTLTFVGPADNPALDILAVREKLSVQVGVSVGGTALLPQIRLVSTPAMSDADKLAWLTLGHGLDQTGRNEAAVLQAAAMALLSRSQSGSGMKGGLASRFGLDELSLGTVAETGERIVTVGKHLGSNVYLGFERGITGAVSVVKITYDLSRRWSVQARAGSENAVDLLYTLGFR